jgi:drug/metabolite transporter (DMT)-like permease
MHLCVLLWGFTAILGSLISLDAIALVFWRVLMVSVCLLCWRPVWRHLARMSRREWQLAGVAGIVVTCHWLAFYSAVKLANASVAATCIALAPVFLSVIEAIKQRRPIHRGEMVLAVISVPGVALVVGGVPDDMGVGVAFGALAALLAAVFTVFNKHLAVRVPALTLTAVELGAGTVFLLLCLPLWPLLGSELSVPNASDARWLAALVVVGTLLPFSLSLVALRKLSAFKAELLVNLEPVYTIALAALLLSDTDDLRWPFYVGVAIILGAVLVHAWQETQLKTAVKSTL